MAVFTLSWALCLALIQVVLWAQLPVAALALSWQIVISNVNLNMFCGLCFVFWCRVCFSDCFVSIAI